MKTETGVTGRRLTYSYDLAGQRSVLRDPNGGRTSTSYDAAGRISRLIDRDSGRYTFIHDAAGQRLWCPSGEDSSCVA